MPSSGFQTCARSEEHTSELQSHDNLVCRLLLEKKWNEMAMKVQPDNTVKARHRRGETPARRSAAVVMRCQQPLPSKADPHREICFFLKKRGPPELPPLPQTADQER